MEDLLDLGCHVLSPTNPALRVESHLAGEEGWCVALLDDV